MNSNFRKAEDAYLRENTEQEEAATLKDEWIENWLESEKVTPEILWEAFNEQTFTEEMAMSYNLKEVTVLGAHAGRMIYAHMRVLASIAYDERMT